jgi:hypothetical protein
VGDATPIGDVIFCPVNFAVIEKCNLSPPPSLKDEAVFCLEFCFGKMPATVFSGFRENLQVEPS